MPFSVGELVEHRSDVALGQGKISSTDKVAGVERVGVRWSNVEGLYEHTAHELSVVRPMPDRLRDVGPASRVPFQLRAFGRWFEARHALTGELSNQPFQMLPHQVIVTNRVVNSRPTNRAWLIADDVGLGKTIEAGMILEVLRKKTLGRFRCLIATPAGLMLQWKEELARRFGREFRVFDSRIPNDLETIDQLVASVDTLRMAKFIPAIRAATPWDLVIFDEAHHLATTPNVLAYQLAHLLKIEGKALNLLFLTATPHSGDNERFFNMLRILREDLFPKGAKDYPHVPLNQVMIRNRKSDVTDIHGKRIFKGIAATKIIHFSPTAREVAFCEELRQYLRNGYKAADKLQSQKGGHRASAVGFLMSTFGKLASSSRSAIESALENRLRALQGDSGVLDEPKTEGTEGGDARFPGEEAARRITSDAIEVTLHKGKRRKESLIEGEVAQVESLLARLRALPAGDSKLTSFVDHMKSLPSDLKVLIFTEYRATQSGLVEALQKHFGTESVATIHGSMKMAERRRQVEDFNEKLPLPNPRFMVSTEAGGEGLNMQKSCHTIVNYDLPWNPMALQQRIGRVYRYGQAVPVVVFNIKVESDSDAYADQRVYEYLEKKIADVTRKLAEAQEGDPEDIHGEVLGQVAEKIPFNELYKTAVEAGRKKAEGQIDMQTDEIKAILADPRGMLGHFRGLERFDITDYEKVAARVSPDHLRFFVTQYLGHQGCRVTESSDGLMSFSVPKRLVDVAGMLRKADPYEVNAKLDEKPIERGTVSKEIAQRTLGCRLLRFGDAAFEAMVRHVQHGDFAAGVASLDLPAEGLGWPVDTQGTWALFDLRIIRQEGSSGGARVLRSELASFVVPSGGPPALRDRVVECLQEAIDGPTAIDHVEATRAYHAARNAADDRLTVLHAEIVKEFGTETGILPQEPRDVGLAWVRAM